MFPWDALGQVLSGAVPLLPPFWPTPLCHGDFHFLALKLCDVVLFSFSLFLSFTLDACVFTLCVDFLWFSCLFFMSQILGYGRCKLFSLMFLLSYLALPR